MRHLLALAATCVLSLVALSTSTPAIATSNITGRISSSVGDAPIAGATVSAYWNFGFSTHLGSALTGSDGTYALSVHCPDANCSLQATAPGYLQGYIPFGNGDGDFIWNSALIPVGTIAGSVTLAVGSAASAAIPIRVERWLPNSASWTQAALTQVPALGGNLSITDLDAGTYRLCAGGGASSLMIQCYDGLEQGALAGPVTYTPVSLQVGETRGGVNFVLRNGGSIEGRLWDGYRNVPMGGSVHVSILDQAGTSLPNRGGDTGIDGSGRYAWGGFATGEYYVMVSTGSAGIKDRNQYVPGISCQPGTCGTVPVGATRVAVEQGAVTSNLDFTFHPYSVQRGTVKSRTTGEVIPTARVAEWGLGYVIQNAYRDPLTGEYIFYIPSSGSRLTVDAPGYVTRTWPGRNCFDVNWRCGVSAQNTVLAPDEIRSGADVLLDPAGRLPVSVQEIGSGLGLQATITIYAADGTTLWTGPNEATVNFALPSMIIGTVFVSAQTQTGCQVYANRPCPAAGESIATVQPTPVQVTETTPPVVIEMPGDGLFKDGFQN